MSSKCSCGLNQPKPSIYFKDSMIVHRIHIRQWFIALTIFRNAAVATCSCYTCFQKQKMNLLLKAFSFFSLPFIAIWNIWKPQPINYSKSEQLLYNWQLAIIICPLPAPVGWTNLSPPFTLKTVWLFIGYTLNGDLQVWLYLEMPLPQLVHAIRVFKCKKWIFCWRHSLFFSLPIYGYLRNPQHVFLQMVSSWIFDQWW